MPGPKTNEREGTRAVLRYVRVSPYKLRQVIDAIRGKPVEEASDLLRFVERDAAVVVGKLLQSAVANAANNDHLDPEELYVSACYVDEGPTAKRWRPRARGRTGRIRKRSSHITVIVDRLPEDRLTRLQARRRAENLAMRARRVEATRRARPEPTEAQNRRERRHPETIPAADEAPGTEEAPETAEAPSAEEALLNEAAQEEGTEAAGDDETDAGSETPAAETEPELEPGQPEPELEAGEPEPELEAGKPEGELEAGAGTAVDGVPAEPGAADEDDEDEEDKDT